MHTCLRFIPSLALVLMLSVVSTQAQSVADGVLAMEQEDYATAYEIWLPYAEEGNAEAQSRLGTLYFWGRGVDQDRVKATELYHLAADQGYVDAMFNLANAYYNGFGVPQDYAQAAVQWNNILMQQPMNAFAMFMLGKSYICSGEVAKGQVICDRALLLQ